MKTLTPVGVANMLGRAVQASTDCPRQQAQDLEDLSRLFLDWAFTRNVDADQTDDPRARHDSDFLDAVAFRLEELADNVAPPLSLEDL